MNITLLIKSVLLSLSSMGFAMNSLYLLGVRDGSICNPTSDPNLAFFMLILCGIGVYAGISIISIEKEKEESDG